MVTDMKKHSGVFLFINFQSPDKHCSLLLDLTLLPKRYYDHAGVSRLLPWKPTYTNYGFGRVNETKLTSPKATYLDPIELTLSEPKQQIHEEVNS